MDVQKLETLPPPPGVFNSLRTGFDVVTNHVALILLPLCLDLFLWLGPRVSVSKLLTPAFQLVFAQARSGIAASDLETFAQTQVMILERLLGFNLLSLLSRLQLFPIGVAGLAAQTQPAATPYGLPSIVHISSMLAMIGLAFVLIPIGWALGGVFFRLVSGSVVPEEEARISYPRAIGQSLLLSAIWMFILMIILFPLMMLIGLFAMIDPMLANIALIVMLFFAFWLIVPLFFSPHGIFIRRENAFFSVYSSLRMVRFTLPTSGLFVLSAFLLANGLDILWSVPKSDSWLMLVGFAGHAFVLTVLLAASFIYYRDMNGWLATMYDHFKRTPVIPPFKL